MITTKVFVISLHKTGTTSMAHFLERLGYLVTVAEPHLFHEAVEEQFEKIDAFLEKYDAFQDDPWYFVYPYVCKKYPDAKFIFLEREETQWLRSVQYFYGKDKYNEKVRNIFYGSADSIKNPWLYLNKYREHKKEVFDFFRNNDNFISVSISKPNDAQRLQTFLGKKVRFRHFPHYKKRPKSGREKVQLKLKHFVASAF
ncbi:hypothetical protein JXB01_01995, partial [Candidatus Micrarchaeota archaeon]|nr:hypothetical protein [Candidatus Micrarchaeota archaeon]